MLKEDWKDPYLRYLLQGVLPTDGLKGEKLKRYMTRFKVVERKLFKRSFQGRWMVGIPTKKANGVLLNFHEGKLARHPGGRRIWQMPLHWVYY